MSCHPVRWLWGLIPVAMLGWLAVHGKSGAIEHDLEQRSAAALSAAGHDWASIAFSGRDGVLVGHASSERDIDTAADLVRSVWGVRVVDVRTASTDITPVSPSPQPSLTRTKSRSLEEFVPIPVAAAGAPDALLADGGPRDDVAVAAAAGEQVLGASHHMARALPVGAATADPVHADDDAPGDVTAHTVRVTPMNTVEPPTPAPPDKMAGEETPAPSDDAGLAEKTQPMSDVTMAGKTATPSAPAGNAVAADVAEPSPAEGESSSPNESAGGEAQSAAVLLQATAPELDPRRSAPFSDAQTANNDVPDTAAVAEAPLPPTPEPPERRPVSSSVSSWSLEAGPQATLPGAPSASRSEPKADAEQPPRFDTAALPEGNIGPNMPCTEDVRSAAKQVEVHFARGDARLDRSGKALLDRLIVTLEACPAAALRIAGHADATGIAWRNLALSKRRARTVVSYLVDKGIDAGRLAAVGYGETRPLAPNTTRANRARNRRIEVGVTARAWPPAPVRKQETYNGLSHR